MMPMLPIRNLGQIGVITDLNAYDLPMNAVSRCNNVRFDDNKIKRANVFRGVLDTAAPTPVFAFTYEVPNGYDKIGIADKNGKLWFYQNGTEDEVTEGTWVASDSNVPFTYTFLQGVGYVNRSDRVPWYYKDGSTDFAKLTNWTSTWRCRSLRAFKDYLIALNVTKSTTNYPTMVKWSDIAQYGSVPGSWDETDTTKSAGENTIAELKMPLLDGLPLRDVFVLYSYDQVWMMEETGDALVFRFRKLFESGGIINTNCVVEIEGRHYVFGPDDIYMHDGNSLESIIKGRNWHKVFSKMSKGESDKFWVHHDPQSSEIIFAYVSGDPDASFTNTAYCNRAAVFNYQNQTWSFIDLPNTGHATIANFSTVVGWSNATGTWDTFGGAWYDQEIIGTDVTFMPGVVSTPNGLTASRLYGYERANAGILPFSISTQATKAAFAERIAVDLDDAGEEIRAYKVIKSIYPQIEMGGVGQTIGFKFSGIPVSAQDVTWSTAVNFTPTTGYKVDTREGGRYLAWRIDSIDYNDFELTGFDADIVTTGRR